MGEISARRRGAASLHRLREETRRADWLDIRAGKIAEGQPLPVKLDRILFEELRADLDAHYKATGALRHPDDVERRLRHLDTAFRGWPAINITPATITAYAARRLAGKVPVWKGDQLVPGARTVAPATVNRELAALRRLLRLAVRNGKLLRAPMFAMLREAPPRAGFLEEAAFQSIVRHLQPVQALAATIAYQTAWRCQSEVLTLQWSRVDLSTGAIRLEPGQTKNGRARTAYLEPETVRLLTEQRERLRVIERDEKRIIPDVFAARR